MPTPRTPVHANLLRTAAWAATWTLAALPALATPSTQIFLSGGLHYPDLASNGAIGNEQQLTAQFDSGVLAGLGQSQSLQRSASGVDGNGTSGNAAFQGAATAEIGTLHVSASADAASTPNAVLAPFPHADANMSVTASFSNLVTLYDPTLALGTPMTVSFSLQLDWQGSFSGMGGSAGNRSGSANVFASLNVAGLANLYNIHFRDTTGYTSDEADAPFVASFANGQVVSLYGQVQVGAQTRVLGASDQFVSASSLSDASNTAHFYIDGAPTLTAIGEGGHNYASAAAVPEPASWALMLAGTLGLLAWRRRQRG